jgi:hypothetical protein
MNKNLRVFTDYAGRWRVGHRADFAGYSCITDPRPLRWWNPVELAEAFRILCVRIVVG